MASLSTNILICMIFSLLTALVFRQRRSGKEFGAFFNLVILLDLSAVTMLISTPIDEGVIRANAVMGYTLNLVYLISLTFASWYWMLYSELVEDSELSHDQFRRRRASIPALAVTVMSIASIWNGMFFSVNERGQYVRGPLYILQFIICYGYVLHSVGRAVLLLMREKQEKEFARSLKIFVLFGVVAALFGVCQALFGGSFILMGMCFGSLCIYTNLTAVRAEEVRKAKVIGELNQQLENKVEVQTEKIRKSNEIIIETLGSIVEDRNMESGTHIKCVKQYTEILARKMAELYPKYGLDEHKVRVIAFASALHDIGKIAISDTVLLKPGKFTPEEFKLMQNHTEMGYEMLKKIKGAWEPEYQEASEIIARYHHERYDGKGYPKHLQGDEIPIASQIVSVADVFDALVTERVYKPAFTPEKAFAMILDGESGQFSPEMLECVKATYPELREIAEGKRD